MSMTIRLTINTQTLKYGYTNAVTSGYIGQIFHAHFEELVILVPFLLKNNHFRSMAYTAMDLFVFRGDT